MNQIAIQMWIAFFLMLVTFSTGEDMIFNRQSNLPACNCTTEPSSRLQCNCSGFHLGNVAVCPHLQVNCADVKELILKNCRITRLNRSLFVNFSSLISLDISSNSLQMIKEDAFIGLATLISLKMTNISFGERIPFGLFKPLMYLDSLDMSGSCILNVMKLYTFFNSVICNVSQVTFLLLDKIYCFDYRYITVRITSEMVTCFENVKKLSLAGNPITYIEPEVVKKLPQLEYLSLFNNRLIPNVQPLMILPSLKNLTYFDIGCQNAIGFFCKDDVPEGFPSMFSAGDHGPQVSNLSVCNASDLIYIDLFLPNLNTLKVHQLHYLYIGTVNFKICLRNNHLINLDISGNQANNISGTLCCMQRLRYFNARNTHVQHLDPYFLHDMPSLEVLLMGGSISERTITSKEAIHLFERNTRLKYLDLSENGISVIPNGIFSKLVQLQTISLAHNKLENLNIDWFRDLPKLQSINVSSNHLKEIPINVLHHIEKMMLVSNISGNEIIFDMRFNPFICGCSTLNTFKWLNRTKVNIIGHNSGDLQCFIQNGIEVTFYNASLYLEDKCHKLDIVSIIFLTCLYPLILFVIFVLSLSYKHSLTLKVAWYTAIKHFSGDESEDFKYCQFDAFISYCSKDEDWVRTVLVKQLESRKKPYKLCIDFRNFMPGEYITDNIIAAIKESRKVILVITKSYIRSGWCDFEMRAAQQQHLGKKRGDIVPIVFPGILKITSKKSAALDHLLHCVTYLEWQPQEHAQRLFWFRLEQTLTKN